jgi:prefoldin subunit 5
MNIKKIETNSKSIRNLSDYSKISKIKKIKEDIDDLNSKIKLKSELLEELKEEKGRVEAAESDLLGTKKKIKDIEAGEEYGNFENLLKEKEGFEGKLKEIGDRLFHDFSSLEKALKKYGKIAFENGKLVEEYLKDPVKALAGDDELKIIKILSSLKQAIKDDKLGLDVRKGEKTLLKIKELEGDYFGTLRGDYKNIKEKLDKTNLEVKNTEVKKQLQSNNEKLEIIKNNIENLNNKVSLINNEIGKIDIEKLKKNLQEKINDTINERIILV